ncbi:RDD family protein, partial [Mycobacteriaceae bacterium Msp059]|nr:RDD family protein [Mycobacteriaceae bacterium Msp059]
MTVTQGPPNPSSSSRDMNKLPTSDEISSLLNAYLVALDTAAALPLAIRIASRPRGWLLFDDLRRLPRPTLGTSQMVLHHVRRSSAALAGRYGLLSASRGLTKDETQARELVQAFNAALPQVRWVLLLPAGLVAVFFAFQVLVGSITEAVADILDNFDRYPNLTAVRELADLALRWVSVVPTGGSSIDLYTQMSRASLAEWLTLTVAILVAMYVVLRPLSAAFRIKRAIFNMATSEQVDLTHTTTTWHVNRSIGVYQLERQLFAGVGANPPREIALDLWISVVPAAVMAWALGAGVLVSGDNTVATISLITLSVAAVVARVWWLWQTAWARRRVVEAFAPPAGFTMPSGAVIESRSVLETAALGGAAALLLWLPFIPPWFGWMRLVRQRRELQGRTSEAWPAVASAVFLALVPPIPLYFHLTGLSRLQPAGGSARRTRDWLVPLSTVVTAVIVVDWFYLDQLFGGNLNGISLVPGVAMFGVAIGAVQREHNAIARATGQPLEFDDPQSGEYDHPVRLYRRVLAGVVEVIPLLVLGAAALYVPGAACDDVTACPRLTGQGRAMLLLIAGIAVLYVIWNWGHRQGRTGRSVGKAALGYRVVDESTGEPIGVGRSLVRQLVHVAVDINPLLMCVGCLFPLWDERRQTLADKIMSTVCAPQRPRRKRSAA